MFKQAIIYYPKDEKSLKQIRTDIAALHCVASVKYMDTLNLDTEQKILLVDSLIKDLDNKESTA